jgi:hypothetical protein
LQLSTKRTAFPEGASLHTISGPVGVPIQEEEMKSYFNQATKEKIGGRQIMQVLFGHNMCRVVIKEDVITELNCLGRHMWLSEVKLEEDGMNMQMEDNHVEYVEAAEDGSKIIWSSKYGEQKEVRGECETDTPSAKKRCEGGTDETEIEDKNSSGFEEFKDETEIGCGTRRD